MCRWAAYQGEEVFLEDIVTAPCHSLIAQSHCAQEAKSPTNGDGFGLAWYGERPEPGLYRDILPAWSDPNLKSLCRQIRSGLFLAHVRASTGGATSRVELPSLRLGALVVHAQRPDRRLRAHQAAAREHASPIISTTRSRARRIPNCFSC